MDEDKARFFFTTLFFPPKLPHVDHKEIGADELLKQVSRLARVFSQHVDNEIARRAWTHLTRSVDRWVNIYRGGNPCSSEIVQLLKNMRIHDVLMFYVKCQNATIVARHRGTGIVFECFEVLPKMEAVMLAKGALVRSFPARAIFIPREVMEVETFVEELATTIYRLTIEPLNQSAEVAKKAGNVVAESREAPSPRFVTEWLFGAVLSAYGKVTSNRTVTKRTRDDVLTKGTGMPWRRSAVWLSIRVALQLALLNSDLDDADHLHYKNFVLFLLSDVSLQLLSAKLDASSLQILHVKIAQRRGKLGDQTFDFVRASVQRTLTAINASIQAVFVNIVRGERATIASVDANQAHAQLSLKNSRNYLHIVWERAQRMFEYPQSVFNPPLSVRIELSHADLPGPDVFEHRYDQLTSLWLVELWIEENLTTWSSWNNTRSSACRELYSLMQAYYKNATKTYTGHAERMSYMLLTIFELWVAIDVISTTLHPLLLDYSPEVQVALFQPLLLNKKSALKRLAQVELHVRARHQSKNSRFPSIFDNPSKNCFAVKLYEKSEHMHVSRQSIEKCAQEVRDHKVQEWQTKKLRFEDLLKTASRMEHGVWRYRGVNRYGEAYRGPPRHHNKCTKCKLEKDANLIEIAKHEWPLPTDEVQCRAVVSELLLPQALASHRDSTWFVVHTIAGVDVDGPPCQQDILLYEPLISYVRNNERQVTLASPVKSMANTHYLKGGLNIDTIFLQNGLVPKLKGPGAQQDSVWTAAQRPEQSLRRHCLSELSGNAPEHLVQQLNSTGHTHNEVLAKRSKCPNEMSLHEHIRFGALRSGEKLQLINILAMIMSSEADINSNPTAVLIIHAMFQVGNRDPQRIGGFLRDSQLELDRQSFCSALLDAVEARFSSIESNWKESTAAGVLLSLPLMVLSLCPHVEMSERCLDLVTRVRQATLKWIRQLAELHSNRRTISAEHASLTELSRQIVNSSLLVRRTFQLDSDRQRMEFAKSTALADYLEASIHLHDHRDRTAGDGTSKHETDHKQQTELLNDAYHARQCEPYLLIALRVGGSGISEGIQRFWKTASFTDSWRSVDDNDTSWIENKSTGQTVHYNLITGSLLVGGKPLCRLPLAYTDDPLYRSIFATLDFEVFPSGWEEMEYVSRVHHQGHAIYFGRRGESLLIRSCHDDEKFEALSRDAFAKDLPDPLLKNSLPWMSLQDGSVSFRRRDRAWSSHNDDWTLFLDSKSRSIITMTSSIGHLIDNCSPIGRHLCSIFEPFEDPRHILIFRSKAEGASVQIKLPRYQLNFVLQDGGQIKCKEFSAVVDRSQTIGTLHGLANKLVLRAVTNPSSSSVRTVLIPNGDVVITSAPPHIKVCIHPGTGDHLTFSQYRLDDLLGQLVSDDLEAHLFKTYLHAITSFPAPDTFTSRDGTEEALFGLSDPITRTSVPFSVRAQELLGRLAALTPVRRFYPKGMQMMQTAIFNGVLPVLAQRDVFFGTVQNMIMHNSQANFLFESASIPVPTYPGDSALLRRSHQTTSKLFANESVADVQLAPEDVAYDSRDLQITSAQGHAFSIASLVVEGDSALSLDPQITTLVKKWKEISGFQQKLETDSLSGMLDQSLQQQWAPLLSWCRTSPSKPSLVFVFSLIAFGDNERGRQLQTLLAFSVSTQLQSLPAPEDDSYDLRHGHTLNQKEITEILEECEKDTGTDSDDEGSAEAAASEDAETTAQRQQIMEAVKTSWPGSRVALPPERSLSHYNYGELKSLLDGRFAAWYRNHKFLLLCADYEQKLKGMQTGKPPPETPIITLRPQGLRRESTICSIRPSLLSIMKTVPVMEKDFCENDPSMLDRDLSDIMLARQRPNHLNANETRAAMEAVGDITNELKENEAVIVQQYGQEILESLAAVEEAAESSPPLQHPSPIFLQEQIDIVQTRIDYILRRCRELLSPRAHSEHGLVQARLWPSVSALTLLQLLSARYRNQLSMQWRKIILHFAEEITALQRLERIRKYMAANDSFALDQELQNPAHAAWSTEEHPDWLLLEIQNQILIRPIQVEIAKKIIEPESGVVLADMGIGKSSTILPMAVTALANGSSLVRVIVLKPLANEMLRILSRSLSGLVGRAVYFLPVSRQTNLTGANPQKLRGLYESCAQNCGVLVSLPEHLNSFRLLCNDKLQTSLNLAHELFDIQKFLDRHARDIIDESDQVLEPGYELVFTLGASFPLSRSPERWIVALEMLDLVQEIVSKISSGLEIERRASDAFGHIRILSEAGSKALMNSVVNAILNGGLPSVPLGHCNQDILQALKSFLQDADVEPGALALISSHFQGSGQLEILYIVRGLVSYNILSHALRKRWLVNYGLDRSRPGGCLSAVPYRAKAVPSQSSEFAQPETMIILTALSYYYTGLLYQELRQCILVLLRLPDPSEEFSKWVVGSKLPRTYRKASSINLDDASCLDTLFRYLRLNKSAIEFFLKHKVFPKEAREFKWKTSTSAWDLCASDNDRVTTGFSGTCDSQIPYTVKKKDLVELKHSIATTLATILRFENRRYICASSPGGRRLTTEKMLDLIVGQPKECSVIIDVGAQFLEDNEEIVKKWLRKCPQKLAAIFFSDSDEKMVLNRDGTTEKLNSSIFKDEIGSCLIYLDEFHTRGTDFRLPDSFAAAVLLGPRLTKDNLVQACMRMRKLAAMQSVIFIAPPEVDQNIRTVTKTPSDEISNVHVVRWAIHHSCIMLQHQQALCATKGLLHSRRRLAATHHVQDNGVVEDRDTYLEKIRERESRSVSEMYRIHQSPRKELPFELSYVERADEVMANQLREWERTDMADFKECGMSEEQEREILHEVEEEREIQRPGEAVPANPAECEALLTLIRDGTMPTGSFDGILPAFEVLNKTSLATEYSQATWPMQILATADFIRTILSGDFGSHDDFLRPVQWVLHAKRSKQPIIISPHEANILMDAIRDSKRATLFLYQARVSKSMPSFDKLDVYKIPEQDNGVTISPEQRAILNLYAGQLYFDTFEDYQVLCTLIGLWDGERELPVRRKVGNDNWVDPACRQANGWQTCTFRSSPVQALKSFFNMRRMGVEWSHSHMGRILTGRLLNRKDFDIDVDMPTEALNGISSVENDSKGAGEAQVAAKQGLELNDKESS